MLAADYARRHGVPRWHDDADAILHAPDIDAVYIATLTDSHCEYTLRAAAAGKPVYVEKPMGMNPIECDDMIAACRTAGVPLWVGYYRRTLPRFLAVRDLIADGAMGDVRMVISRQFQQLPAADQFTGGAVPWRVNPDLSGGGFFFEAVCHTFDFLDFLFGPIVDVRALAGNQAGAYRPEDIVMATYRFASGVGRDPGQFPCGGRRAMRGDHTPLSMPSAALGRRSKVFTSSARGATIVAPFARGRSAGPIDERTRRRREGAAPGQPTGDYRWIAAPFC
ncbi:MAG: Gfo/Idh/MocA family oxidoreductase [Betaproteobacteria bacterium]